MFVADNNERRMGEVVADSMYSEKMRTVVINGQTYWCEDDKLLLQNVAERGDFRRFNSVQEYQAYLFWIERLQKLVGQEVAAAEIEYRKEAAEPWFPVLRFANGSKLTLLSGDGSYDGGRFEVSTTDSQPLLFEEKKNFFGKWMDNRAVECSRCGQLATVPFTPQPGRPVYCRESYELRTE